MRKRSSISIICRMIALAKPLTGHMILAVIFGTLGHLSAIAIPILGATAILCALELLTFPLKPIFIIMLCCGIFRGVFAYIEQNRNHYIAFRLLALIRDNIFSALRKLCPAKLDNKNRGNLISVITADIELLEVFYAHTISPVIIATLVSTAMVIFMAQFHWIFALTAATAYIITGVILPILMSRKSQMLFAVQRKEFGELSGYYMDSLRGLSDIIQLDCGEKRLCEIQKKTEKLEKKLKKISKEDGKVSAVADSLVIGFSCLILVQAFVLKAEFSYILLPVIAMLSSFGPVLSLSRLSTGLSRMLAAGERVLNLLDEVPEVVENTTGETPEFTGASTNNLNFAYKENIILKNLSINFTQGKIIGIHGKSGSGKSTLLKLLMRFWSVPNDSISISNVDINNIKTSHLRNIEGYMTQETDLFHASIADNIRVGKLNATQEEIENAAKKASLHDFIMTLPQDYQTNVGELGDTLSGGEKQRIGLARAFLHDAPLMLLDEPTSNLDSLNEAIILKSLKEEQQNRTIILVSHRKSTLAICDHQINLFS